MAQAGRIATGAGCGGICRSGHDLDACPVGILMVDDSVAPTALTSPLLPVPLPQCLRGVLFDLDGTLIDPRAAISGALSYAFVQMGRPVPPHDVLVSMIGPPLLPSLQGLFGMSEADALATIEHYRVDFGTRGIAANVVYPGIPELLAALHAHGVTIALATSKPTVYAVQILEHLGIDRYFAAMVGSNLDNTRTAKSEVIAHALHLLPELRDASIMVGDREHDLHGARANDLPCIGVTYGIGSVEEVRAAAPLHVVSDVAALQALLQRLHLLPDTAAN